MGTSGHGNVLKLANVLALVDATEDKSTVVRTGVAEVEGEDAAVNHALVLQGVENETVGLAG